MDYDETGSIGKRYRRQDEIGTPYCITVDFDTVEDGTVTVRDRDAMTQVRVRADDLPAFIGARPGVLTPHDGERRKSPASAIFSDRAYEMFAPGSANSDRCKTTYWEKAAFLASRLLNHSRFPDGRAHGFAALANTRAARGRRAQRRYLRKAGKRE